MCHRFAIATVLVSLAFATVGFADFPKPTPPEKFDVELRYRIYAGRNERLRQYDKLLRFFEKIGFEKDPGSMAEPLDTRETRMRGTISSARARQLLYSPYVKTILLKPAGYELPQEGMVKVHIEITDGLPPNRQRLLSEQSAARLRALGFVEFVGYDHRGFTRLVGLFPASRLPLLLKDLRGQPTGWLLPDVLRRELPSPLKQISPLRVVEIVPEPEGVAAWRPPPEAPKPFEKGKEFYEKIGSDLLKLLDQKEAGQPTRLEVILRHVPDDQDISWLRTLNRAVPDLVIEGRLGPMLTVYVPPNAAPSLARLPIVSTVRLPIPARPQARFPQGTRDGNLEALKASGLMRLHMLGHRGAHVRVAVVDGDFRGWEVMQKQKRLPTTVHYVDLTAERNPDLRPDPFPGDPKQVGHGTEMAMAVAIAAPKAEMTLIRIDPRCPHQLEAVARYINGEDFKSASYFHRQQQLAEERQKLDERKEKLLFERKIVLDDFRQTAESKKRKDAYFQAQAAFDKDVQEFDGRMRRFLQLHEDFRKLRGIQIVTSPLVWNVGYPLGAASPLTRYFDDRPFRASLWFQSAGNTRGQTWSGLFRDEDGNGVMEFSPPRTQLPPQRWTSELNFLAWKPWNKPAVPELPEKLDLRLSLQWKEVHAPEFYQDDRDPYRTPLAMLRLVVLRQRDPSGRKVHADEMEVVAYSTGLPQRIDNRPGYAIYEMHVDFTAEPSGRYAVRIEGFVPQGIYPPDAPTMPAMQRSWELYPRLFVDVKSDAFRNLGRAVFEDFPTDIGALGTPADSRSVITVGAADAHGQAADYSAHGPPLNLSLLAKPDTLSQSGLQLGGQEQISSYGTSQAAAFAAGLTAASFGYGIDRAYFLRALNERKGKPLLVP
ncbi:MAG: hypothetical protein KatS3mg105_4173 [Gemmatales bacterium]|nr:MAG: hypothetical protein KatS3mg105_4173 [Gemmatales bacterium]